MMNNLFYSDIFDLLPKWRYERNRPDLMPPKEQGRNEPCNCGSGKKYKKCCGIRLESEGEKG